MASCWERTVAAWWRRAATFAAPACLSAGDALRAEARSRWLPLRMRRHCFLVAGGPVSPCTLAALADATPNVTDESTISAEATARRVTEKVIRAPSALRPHRLSWDCPLPRPADARARRQEALQATAGC